MKITGPRLSPSIDRCRENVERGCDTEWQDVTHLLHAYDDVCAGIDATNVALLTRLTAIEDKLDTAMRDAAQYECERDALREALRDAIADAHSNADALQHAEIQLAQSVCAEEHRQVVAERDTMRAERNTHSLRRQQAERERDEARAQVITDCNVLNQEIDEDRERIATLEARIAELEEAVGQVHDALGESRDSDDETLADGVRLWRVEAQQRIAALEESLAATQEALRDAIADAHSNADERDAAIARAEAAERERDTWRLMDDYHINDDPGLARSYLQDARRLRAESEADRG